MVNKENSEIFYLIEYFYSKCLKNPKKLFIMFYLEK